MDERLTFNYGNKVRRAMPPGTIHADLRDTDQLPDDEPPTRRRAPRDLAFLGLMAFTAVLYFRPQDVVRALEPLHLAELTALAALSSLVFRRLSRGLPVSRFTPELAGVVALGAVILVTAPFSIWMGGAIGTFTELYVKVLLIFVLIINTLTSLRRIEQFTWLIVAAIGYLAVRAVFDYVRGVNLVENGRVRGAVGGIFKNPNDLAMNLVAVIPMAAWLALRPGPILRRALAAGCVLAMMGATVATQSRSGTVGLLVIAMFFAVQLIRRRPALVFGGALALVMALPLLPASYLNRVYSISNPSLDDTGSREARRILLHEAAAAFAAHPLTGVGAGQFRNYNPEGRQEAWREAHNVVLQVAAELGIMGLGCFMFLVARGFVAPLQTRRLLTRIRTEQRKYPTSRPPLSETEIEALDGYRMAMSASIAGWFVCALFGSVAYNWTFYYLLAMAVVSREVVADRLRLRGRPQRAGAPIVAVEARV